MLRLIGLLKISIIHYLFHIREKVLSCIHQFFKKKMKTLNINKEPAVKQPPTCFMIFFNEVRELYRESYPHLKVTEISKVVGQ